MIRFVHPSLGSYREMPPDPARREGGSRLAGKVRSGTPEMPLVTVVTAVFNGEKFLARSIESVLSQTYPNVEYVIADGASKDGTIKVVEGFGDAIDYWVSERDESMFDGMNRGVAKSTGRFVKIHGCDDVMPPDSVEQAVEVFRRAGSKADEIVVRGDMQIIDDHENVMTRVGLAHGHRYSPAILHPAWYVPMKVYERHGLYDPGCVVSSDYEMYFYLAGRGVAFHHAERPLTHFRTGGTSSTFAGFRDGFEINRRYQGIGPAAYMFAMSAVRTTSRMALGKVIGVDRANGLRRWMKQLRA